MRHTHHPGAGRGGVPATVPILAVLGLILAAPSAALAQQAVDPQP